MVDIQCPTAEIRRGNEKRRLKKPQDENILSASATQGGHKKIGRSADGGGSGLKFFKIILF